MGLIAGAAASVYAQNASSTGTASATVIKQIGISPKHELSFGQLIPSGTAGTACIKVEGHTLSNSQVETIPPTVTSCTAVSLNQPSEFGGDQTPGPAIFLVTGEKNFTFGITLPNAVNVTISNFNPGATPADDMTIDNFLAVVQNNGTLTTTGTLDVGNGSKLFYVGGLLHVHANQPQGAYSGSFPMTVFYN